MHFPQKIRKLKLSQKNLNGASLFGNELFPSLINTNKHSSTEASSMYFQFLSHNYLSPMDT